MSRNTRLTIGPGLLSILWAISAEANPMEDTFGVGSRVKAMGGAGVSISDNYAALFYNPARLSRCGKQTFSASYHQSDHQLRVRDFENEPLEAEPIAPRYTINAGLCLALPFDLHFGFYFGAGLDPPMLLRQRSAHSVPEFLQHNSRLDSLSIVTGFSYGIVDNLALGISLSVLASSDLSLDLAVPVLSSEEVAVDLNWYLQPTAAIYAGLYYEPISELTLGLTYRSALYHRLYSTTETQAAISGIETKLDLILEGAMWYSPQQLSSGLAYKPIDMLLISVDLTWYNWAAYPGPFIVITAIPDSALASSLNFPRRNSAEFQDTWAIRTGLEYNFEETVFIRGGYGLQTTAVKTPASISNILDHDTHQISLGGGYHLNLEHEDSNVMLKFNLHATVGLMPNKLVQKPSDQPEPLSYQFGGTFLNIGTTIDLQF